MTSPLMLPVLWFTAQRYRGRLRLPFPPAVTFIGIGAPLAALAVGFTVAFGLSPDLDKDPVVNTLLYVGPWGGKIAGWYAVRHFYAFTPSHVFWISGLLGSIEEQQYLVPRMALSGDAFGALLTTIYLIPAYGVATVLMFVLTPDEELPRGMRRPGVLGYLLFLVVPVVMFYVGAVVWYVPLGAILGRNLISD